MTIPEDTETSSRRKWLTAGAWLLLVGGLAAAFGHNFWEMWQRWFPAWRHTHYSLYDRIVEGESYYTHGPLVPLVSLMIALLLVRHTRIPVRPRRRAGAVVLAVSVLLHLMSCLARVNFASGFALIGVLAGLVLLLWGGTALRRLWFPIALLVFMVPLPEVTIYDLNFRLKMSAAEWGVRLAGLLGIAAERSGNRVFLEGDKSLIIANVCNGLRTLISLLAFGALYAYVCRLRGLWRIFLFAMSVPVAVVSNSIRIVSLILVAHVWDTQVATGWYHDASGALIFFVAFAMMFGLERLILWLRQVVGRPAKVLPLFHDARRTEADEGQWSRLVGAAASGTGRVAVLLILFAAGGAWWLNRSVPPIRKQQLAREAVPATLKVGDRELTSYELEMDERTLTILETRDYLFRRYVAAEAAPLDFCIIFSQDNRKGTHPPDVCLAGSGEGIVGKGDVFVDNVQGRAGVPCRELIVQSGPRQHYHLYTYKCGRRYTGSFWVQQFVIFANGLLARNASGALIRVSTPVTAGLAEARARSVELLRVVVPHLDRGLP